MTRSNPRTDPAALSAAFSRAVDLSALKRPAAPAAPAAPGGSATRVVDVTEATFGPEVIEKSSQVLVFVDVGSPRSPLSVQVGTMMERVVGQHPGSAVLVRVDADAQPRIAQAFGVQAVPTVIAVVSGQPVDAFTGDQPEAQVAAWVQSLVDAVADRLPGIPVDGDAPAEPSVDPLVLAAEDALEAGDLAAAITAYETLVAQHPGDTEAATALAQLRFQDRAAGLPTDAVDRAAAAPDDTAAQIDAADLLFATGRTEESYGLLVDAVARLAGDDRSAVRDHLLELFALVGNDDPVVIAYRRKLAAALY